MTQKKDDRESTAGSGSAGPTPAGPKKPEILLQMLPIVFHKLKNKLTPILGYAQILKTKCTDEFVAGRLQKIETGALDFTELLNKLKEYFKVEKGPRQKANLNSILQGIADRLRARAQGSGVAFKIELDPAVPDDILYPDEIDFLVSEMTENAILSLLQKNAPDKMLAISSQRLPGGYALKVRDNGMGIGTEELDKIWAPFYSTRGEHAGLGLVICEKIIANHGATCTVTSTPGEFCEFSIFIPVEAKP